MTGIGVLVGPITHGDPLMSVLAGFVLAALVASAAAAAKALLRLRRPVVAV
ncbi:hypothetical protein GTW08_06260 [Pseudonocardia sp. SID8383]|nr:hypothetical protein [Pseudonocardia sp. SID8383]